MWIARESDGSLYLFERKPELQTQGCFKGQFVVEFGPASQWDSDNYDLGLEVNSKFCPEVTHENSPKEIVITKMEVVYVDSKG